MNPALQRYLDALPQKPPARFVDELLDVEHLRQAVGAVSFPPAHRVFENHLPNRPLVPGVILIEALAQLSGLVMIPAGERAAVGFLAEVRRMRLRRLVHPGERIVLRSTLRRRLGTAAAFVVSATVDGAEAAAGELVLGGMG